MRYLYSSTKGLSQLLSVPHEGLLGLTSLQCGSSRVKLLNSTLLYERTEVFDTRRDLELFFPSTLPMKQKHNSFLCLPSVLSSTLNKECQTIQWYVESDTIPTQMVDILILGGAHDISKQMLTMHICRHRHYYHLPHYKRSEFLYCIDLLSESCQKPTHNRYWILYKEYTGNVLCHIIQVSGSFPHHHIRLNQNFQGSRVNTDSK